MKIGLTVNGKGITILESPEHVESLEFVIRTLDENPWVDVLVDGHSTRGGEDIHLTSPDESTTK